MKLRHERGFMLYPDLAKELQFMADAAQLVLLPAKDVPDADLEEPPIPPRKLLKVLNGTVETTPLLVEGYDGFIHRVAMHGPFFVTCGGDRHVVRQAKYPTIVHSHREKGVSYMTFWWWIQET